MLNLLKQVIRFISEGVVRIFAPNNDHYPSTGEIPFTGRPHNRKSRRARWAS
jgi:hypothetical protein